MKTSAFAALVGLSIGLAAGSCLAQPKSREDVRAEAASAAKAGQIERGTEPTTAPPAKSTKARAEVKADTRSAVKAGVLEHGEETSTAPPPGPSLKTRAEVKAETASAIHVPPPAKKTEAVVK